MNKFKEALIWDNLWHYKLDILWVVAAVCAVLDPIGFGAAVFNLFLTVLSLIVVGV